MRILIYNIAYATGAPRSQKHAIFSSHRAILPSKSQLALLKEFIVEQKPDLIGLIEVDIGSYRNSFSCQAHHIAHTLGLEVHRNNKYQYPLLREILPIFKHQGNAVITKKDFSGQFHFFSRGMKRLIIEVDCKNFTFFLVHLALSKKVRTIQLKHLIDLALSKEKPYIIAGDFNTFSGETELDELKSKLNLVNANTKKLPTFPSWQPKFQLDYILHSPEIKLNEFSIIPVCLSDHLPIIADFDITL